MLRIVREWLANFKHYSKVKENTTNKDDWRTYMENNTSPLGGSLRCFNAGIFKYRRFLVLCLLCNVITLYMVATTHVMFTPDLTWRCITEQHTNLTRTNITTTTSTTAICDNYSKKTNKKNAVCMMELGVDFDWDFTFTKSPIIEYIAFCPLQRSVEPKLVNFLGSFCGSLVGGIFIDTLGRKNMSLICTFFSILTTLSYKFSTNMIMFTYQEFIKGAFTSVAAMSLITWCVELSKPKYCSLVVACFFVCSTLGEMLTTAVTYLSMEWRRVVVVVSCIGLALVPLIFLIPSSLRYMVARGKTKNLPKAVNFREGAIMGARAKDCLSRPQTNRLYGINAIFLILTGFSTHLLMEVFYIQHKHSLSDPFSRALMMQMVLLIGHVLALFVALLPMLIYIINVFMVLIAGILAIVATSTNYSDSSLARVFTGSCLMLVALSVSLTFTTMRQIPTLNRGFYVSGLNASYMLGSLVYIIVQSWCLERENEANTYCSTGSEDIRLITGGIILLIAVAFSFVNTCLTRNINLPHSYGELKRLRHRVTSRVVEEEEDRVEMMSGNVTEQTTTKQEESTTF